MENFCGISIIGCSIQETRAEPGPTSAIRWIGKGSQNLVGINGFQLPESARTLDADAHVIEYANVTG